MLDLRTLNRGRPPVGKGNGKPRIPEHLKNVDIKISMHPMMKMMIDAECERTGITKCEFFRRLINTHFRIGEGR